MLRRLLAAAIFLAALGTVGGLHMAAQDQGAAQAQNAAQTPDAPRPQPVPQSKKTDKKQTQDSSATSGSDTDSAKPASGSKSSPGGDANPFPEDVSRQAAEAAHSGESSGSASQAPATSPAPPHSSASDSNPFPEDVSRRAAGDTNAAKSPGVSSSSSAGLGEVSPDTKREQNHLQVNDPARSKKDTQVGDFYFAQGNEEGPVSVYKDAINSDPTNMDAVFGLAEAAMRLKKFPEAERNYEIYLYFTKKGPKAKRALKELSSLAGKK